jgi:MFS family permease
MMLAGLAMLAGSVMNEIWQLNLFWGLMPGIGAGLAAAVLGATVANRWFVARRGLVTGIFGGATSAGQLIFIPSLMTLTLALGWRQASLILALIALTILAPIVLLMRIRLNRPPAVRWPGAPAGGGGARWGDGDRPADAGILALGRELFRLRRDLDGPDRHPLHPALGRPRCVGGQGGRDVGADRRDELLGTSARWLTDRVDPRKLLASLLPFRGLCFDAAVPRHSDIGLVFGHHSASITSPRCHRRSCRR